MAERRSQGQHLFFLLNGCAKATHFFDLAIAQEFCKKQQEGFLSIE